MARYTGPVCKLCRREGIKLGLKGERCFTQHCALERRAYAPGSTGQKRGRKPSEYALQLREKQKTKRSYGLLERQFRKYFDIAESHHGVTGEVLLQLLEMRFDNVVYRMGFADSRPQARQLVRHGHFTVNGRPTNIPSFATKPGDVIAVKDTSKNNREYFKGMVETLERHDVPDWISLDAKALSGKVIRVPERDEIGLPIEEALIVEFYSR
jgi:small subunit ribosomal protein S4